MQFVLFIIEDIFIEMKELVCYLLARLGGNEKPTKEDIENILKSVAIEADNAKLSALFDDIGKLDGGVDAAIAKGMSKLAVLPAGGGGGGAPVSGGAPAAHGGAAASKPAEKAKEDTPEKEESVGGQGQNLFGGADESESSN